MLRGFGPPEMLIVFLIIVLLFGIGRIGKIGKELGTGIRAFKEGLSGEDKKEETQPEDKKE